MTINQRIFKMQQKSTKVLSFTRQKLLANARDFTFCLIQ